MPPARKKPFNIMYVVAPLALIAAVTLFVMNAKELFRGGQLPATKLVINVFTGEVREIDMQKFVPAKDSEGRKSLYPVHRNEDGTYQFEARYLDRLNRDFGREVDLAVDLQTGKVLRTAN